MHTVRKTTVMVEGMHCPSCDILVKDKFMECGNVQTVTADHKTQIAEITYTGDLSLKELHKKVAAFGYQVAPTHNDGSALHSEPTQKRLLDTGAIAVILFILYFFVTELKLLPAFSPANLSVWVVFVLGLVASTSTCMATSGALFLSTIGSFKETDSGIKGRLLPAVSFNIGRIVSYGLFGYIAGLAGQAVSQHLKLGSVFTLAIAVVMLFIGLDMSGVLPFSSIGALSWGKNLFAPLKRRFITYPKRTAFLLGAITYLLPCGFTQTVQIYALGLADPLQSAITMMIFALGTTPALMAVGFAASLTKKKWYPVFARVMGVVIIMIGVSYISNVLFLYGIQVNPFAYMSSSAISLDPNVKVKDGVQVASMQVRAEGYSPLSFTVRRGVPVRWEIDGENVFGCQGFLVAPKIHVEKTLAKGHNVIEFTPHEAGRIDFSCAMGMFRGAFNVVEG